MTEIVPADQIETLVGARRLNSQHLARADSREQMVYILHAHQCVRNNTDLRECPFSLALDRGIDHLEWLGWEDRPVQVVVRDRKLIPVRLPRGATLVCDCAANGDGMHATTCHRWPEFIAAADRSAEPPAAP